MRKIICALAVMLLLPAFSKIQPVHRLQEQLFCKVKQLGDVVFEYADSLF